MGQGVQKASMGVSKARQARPNPHSTSSLSLRQKYARAMYKLVSSTYVLKNKILQHESYSSSSHDSNDIKNLI